MAGDDERPIIIVKKVKKVAGGHHGGAWKVAYADFVTAMMAFFLLLWLLNVTTDEQKFGIANYFDPLSVSRSVSGSGGVLGGKSMIKDGALVSPASPMGIDLKVPGLSETEAPENESNLEGREIETTSIAEEETLSQEEKEKLTKEELDRLQAKEQQKEFEAAAEKIRQAIESSPELAELSPHLIIDQTPDGLRIQIIDQKGRSMFPIGSANMYEETKGLIGLVAGVIKKLPNKISVTGHTDSAAYGAGASYTNWELSVDRANSSRRALLDAGLSPQRINHVVGKADTEHLVIDDPLSPKNRRISIILLKDQKLYNPDLKERTQETSTPQEKKATLPPQQKHTPSVRPVDALDYQ